MLGLLCFLVVQNLGVFRGRRVSFDLGHAEDRLPPVEAAVRGWGREAEPGDCKSPLGPAVVDMREMPLHCFRSSVHVKLVANVDEVLDRCYVHVVDRGEIKDDGAKDGQVRTVRLRFALPGPRVVPWTVARVRVGKGVGATGSLEDRLHQVIGVMVGIRVIEPFRESINEDARVRLFHIHLGVRPIVVVDGKIDRSVRLRLII